MIVKTKLLFNTLFMNHFVVKFFFINKIIADPPKALKVNLEYTKGKDLSAICWSSDQHKHSLATLIIR